MLRVVVHVLKQRQWRKSGGQHLPTQDALWCRCQASPCLLLIYCFCQSSLCFVHMPLLLPSVHLIAFGLTSDRIALHMGCTQRVRLFWWGKTNRQGVEGRVACVPVSVRPDIKQFPCFCSVSVWQDGCFLPCDRIHLGLDTTAFYFHLGKEQGHGANLSFYLNRPSSAWNHSFLIF